jgi:selenocysteine-specific elongation factor
VLGLDELLRALGEALELPRRSEGGPLYMAVDHCFPIKGQGTVLTGTVLSGAVGVNDVVELPELGEQRKVKSMQMFHRPVKAAAQGDRVALCVTSLDAKAIERGIVATPGSESPSTRLW